MRPSVLSAAVPATVPALALILSVLAALWPRTPVTPLSSYDQRFYLGIAYDLRQYGRFTDGFSYAGGGAMTHRPPGMRFAPLYPAFLAAMASLDPALLRGIDCVEHTHGEDPDCPRSAPLARSAQFLMLACFYLLLWTAIGRAAGSSRAGWIGLGIGLLASPALLRFANTLMTETMSLLLSSAACTLAASAVRAHASGKRAWTGWLACGLVLGLASLCRPALLALAPLGLCLGAALALRYRGARMPRAAGAFGIGVAVVVLPWVLRNALVLHRAALTFGYASHTLIQRIAFDAMTPREYALSFVCWLPDGAGLGRLIAGAHTCDRFGWDEHPDSFYAIGTGPLMRRSLDAAGGWNNMMPTIIHHDLLAHPLRHLLVTIPLALRGLWIDHYWGLLLAPISLLVTLRALRRGQLEIIALSAPAWLLLLLNALVAVNQTRYNLLLVLPFSLAGAVVFDRLWKAWKHAR